MSEQFEFPNGTSISRLLFSPSSDFLPGQAFNVRGFSLLDSGTFVARAIGDPTAREAVTRGGYTDSSIYRDGVIPGLPDIVLSPPTAGFGAQVFDNGNGKRIHWL